MQLASLLRANLKHHYKTAQCSKPVVSSKSVHGGHTNMHSFSTWPHRDDGGRFVTQRVQWNLWRQNTPLLKPRPLIIPCLGTPDQKTTTLLWSLSLESVSSLTLRELPLFYDHFFMTFRELPLFYNNFSMTFRELPLFYDNFSMTLRELPLFYDNFSMTLRELPSFMITFPWLWGNYPYFMITFPWLLGNYPSFMITFPWLIGNYPSFITFPWLLGN